MEKVVISTVMETDMMESGSRIKNVGKESIIIVIWGINIMDSGIIIIKMDLDFINMEMVMFMKVNL